MLKTFVTAAIVVLTAAGTTFAQTAGPNDAEQIRARQRISYMEAILQRAVSNGADMVLRQVSSVMPVDRPTLSGLPQVNGFRLEGYGIFFHVRVPGLILPLMWPLRQMVLETENRSAMLTLQQMQREVATLQGRERERLQQMIRNLELQLETTRARTAPRDRGVSAATLVADAPAQGAPPVDPAQATPPVDPAVVDDPQAAYTQEVKEALINAMLENNQALAIGAGEWLTIAAHDAEPRNPLLPGDTVDWSTWMMRIKGSDLTALRSGAITLEEARKRVEVRED